MIENKLSVQEMKMVVGDLVFRLYEEILDLNSAGREVVKERDDLKAEVVVLQAKLLQRMLDTAGGPKDSKDSKDGKDGKDGKDSKDGKDGKEGKDNKEGNTNVEDDRKRPGHVQR
jgi:hypothetical protein